jgi:mannose-6-phosphate isomerase-like protein (cupin superfamily)
MRNLKQTAQPVVAQRFSAAIAGLKACATKISVALALAGGLAGIGWAQTSARDSKLGGYIIERDADVATPEPAPHNGGGQSVAYSFFKSTPRLTLVFRKRVLKPGAAIGYHEQKEDEIYYVLSGRGVMTLDGKAVDVGPGTAVLTRPGSSHGIKQAGTEDLVLLINYEQAPK